MKYEPVIQSEMIVTNTIQIDDPKIATSFVPVGSLIYSFSKSAPNGYLVCNGAEVSIETYQKLYDCIGDTYGTGSTNDKFKLPNLINRFPHGHTTVGTVKDAGLPNITGKFSSRDSWSKPWSTFVGTGSLFVTNDSGVQNIGYTTTGGGSINIDASLCSSIYGSSTTVQPPALTVLPCIKY